MAAELKAEWPAIRRRAKDFDTPDKRQWAAWAVSTAGQRVYRLAYWNHHLKPWLACDFGHGIGYTRRVEEHPWCYPAAKAGAVAGYRLAE